MPVPKLYPESVAAKFRPGTLKGIESALVEGETRAEFIRRMVEIGVAIGDMKGFKEAVLKDECRSEFVRRMVEEGLARREAQAAEAAGRGPSDGQPHPAAGDDVPAGNRAPG